MELNFLVGLFALFIITLTAVVLWFRSKIERIKNEKNEISIRMEKIDQKISEVTDALINNLSNQLRMMADNFRGSIGAVQRSFDQRLHESTQRLDVASKSYAEVKAQLAELQQHTKRVWEVGKDISSLQEILRAPKLRGSIGEIILESVLSQTLPEANFDTQYMFKSGAKVDAVVKLKEYIIPVDSKFPLENFKKAIESSEEKEREFFKRLFFIDVKKHIDSISKKYILPDEGTIDFALMYIPAENVYYEIIKSSSGSSDICEYSWSKRVIPVSPNTLHIYLQTIALGLKGMKIEENAKMILESLKILELEFNKIKRDFQLLGTHIENAQKKYVDTQKRIDRYEMKIEKSKMREIDSLGAQNLLNEANVNEISEEKIDNA